MDSHAEDKHHNEHIDKEELMKKDPSCESVYSGPTHNDVRRLICEALKELEER